MSKNRDQKRKQGNGTAKPKADIYLYTAMKKKAEAEKILKDAGYLHKPNSPMQMADMLAHYVFEGGEPALMKIAQIHPDYKIISEAYQKSLQTKNADGEEEYEECLGCLGADGQPKTENKNLLNNTQLLIIGGTLVLSLSLITLIVVSNKK